MKIEYEFDGYSYLTDNTNEIDEQTLFLKTKQNQSYFDDKHPFIEPKELMGRWSLGEIKVVGITGTNGKTTVSAAIYSMLLDLGYKAALQGTRGLFANDIQLQKRSMTTPSILETLYNIKLAAQEKAEFFIMEVSSHAIDQERIEGIEFALKVLTNITSDHLDYHGTVEEYRRVKSRFFADEALKLLNKDEIKKVTYNVANAYSYGVDEPASFKIKAYSLNSGIVAGVSYFDQESTFDSSMVGLFNLYNLLSAVASVVLLTNRTLQEVCEVVEGFGGVAGRMEVVSQNPMVVVDFAHTEDGIEKVLDSIKHKDIVVVFGAGGDRDRQKRPKMGRVVGKYASKIFVTSDNPRSEEPQAIIDEIMQGLQGKANVHCFVDRKEAIAAALKSLQQNEILLILGKGDEDYQEIKGVKEPFSDKLVVQEFLA